MSSPSLREHIYYWKCDRPSAFHGVLRQANPKQETIIQEGLRALLQPSFPAPIRIHPASGEGVHRTYLIQHREQTYFARVEDGPEGDTHLEVESGVLAAVASAGIPAPKTIFCDSSRRQVPFSVQVITYYPEADLNKIHRTGQLHMASIAEALGRAIARWQRVPVSGFGPFKEALPHRPLLAYHASYSHYFYLHLERHLYLLKEQSFLSGEETSRIHDLIKDHSDLLQLDQGCLVHKDLALWNILGTANHITAFIDWDDAISGDPADDLSLLACFHSGDFLTPVLRGYESEHPLPPRFTERFWLHLLRNMIVKAVIRTCAGYFARTQGNFLMSQGGSDLQKTTREKLQLAYKGLSQKRPFSDL